ncbi:hypothetical protein RSP_0079 [Pseudomonas phage RSP]|nr:hypothetical protein RSP_0079 [Pseudomonas phage RSP]
MNKSENGITGGRFCEFHGGPLACQQMRKDAAEFTDLYCSWLRVPGRDDGVYAVKTSYFCQDKDLDVFVYVWTGREDYDPDALVFPNSSPTLASFLEFDGCSRIGVAPTLASILERGARLRAKAEENRKNTQQPQEGHAMKKYRFYEDPDTRLLADQIERTAEELAGLIAGTLQHLDFHKHQATGSGTLNDPGDPEELRRLANAEPERWVSIARTHFQEGLMALRRAVEQPERF